MIERIKKLFEDKKEYREQMRRVDALPEEYRFVFEKIQEYIWNFAGGDGMDMLKTQYALIELFETGATEGKRVLDITGQDIAGFCNELIYDTKKWTDHFRKKLNKDVTERREKRNRNEKHDDFS